MIYVYLNGGIGNLLFQYAAGLGLAKRLNVALKLDKSYYHEEHYTGDKLTDFYHIPYFARILESSFNISADEATQTELKPFRHSPVKKAFERLKPYYKRKVFRQQKFSYDPNFFKASKNILLKGNWQSEKYFAHIASLIKQEFTFKKLIIDRNKHLTERLNQSTSIALHIRRKDYVSHPVTSNFIGALPIEYYQKAIRHFRSKIEGDMKFYVFSDDMMWAKNSFSIEKNIVFVDSSFNLTDADEMYLMSQCRHNIIANSSFSWWGAWLNNNPDKIVIAPKKWFNKGHNDTEDLIPEGWLRI